MVNSRSAWGIVVPSSSQSKGLGTFISASIAASLISIAVVWLNRKQKIKKSVDDHGSDKKEPPIADCSAEQFLMSAVQQDGHIYLMDMCRRLGEVYCVDMWLSRFLPVNIKRYYVVCDHRAARMILESSASKNPQDVQPFVNATNGGMNMIAANGHRWKHVRKATASAFSNQNMTRLLQETITPVLKEWMEQVLEPFVAQSGKNSGDKSSQGLDILREMNRITSDVITRGAFDYKMTPEEREDLLQNIKICWTEFFQINPLRHLPFIRCFFPGIRKAKRAAKAMYAFCEKMLLQYRDKVDKKPHMLIDMILNDTEYVDDSERISDMIGYLIGGFDTTSNTIAFAFRELALHVDEQSKLRAVLRQCSSSDDASKCPAMKHFMREIMRMYPSLVSARIAGTDIALPDLEYVIPSGSATLIPYYVIQRNEKIFKDPDSFIPARWENPSDAAMRSILTFSAGYRSCQGQALAQMEITEILYRLISTYEFGIVTKGEPKSVVLFKPVGTSLSVKKAE